MTSRESSHKYGPPLSEEEYQELANAFEELGIDADGDSADLVKADAIMVAAQLLPGKLPTREWMKLIHNNKRPDSDPLSKKLRSLLLRRFEQIGTDLENSAFTDPILLVDEEDGEDSAYDSISEYALFLCTVLAESEPALFENELFKRAFGILAICSNDLVDEFEPDEKESKEIGTLRDHFESSEDATLQMLSAIACIAYVTKGYPIAPIFWNIETEWGDGPEGKDE